MPSFHHRHEIPRLTRQDAVDLCCPSIECLRAQYLSVETVVSPDLQALAMRMDAPRAPRICIWQYGATMNGKRTFCQRTTHFVNFLLLRSRTFRRGRVGDSSSAALLPLGTRGAAARDRSRAPVDRLAADLRVAGTLHLWRFATRNAGAMKNINSRKSALRGPIEMR
jgi:hypothetical protein